jgi:uncharacterized membrane protein YdbT with pleckstrin-like domain
MAIKPPEKPVESKPASREERVGEHTAEQAETLLSQPFQIPRNPISINARFIVLMVIGDGALLMVFLFTLFALSSLRISVGVGIMVALVVLVVIKATLLTLILVKMTSSWSQVSYYLTDRALIVKRGLLNSYEETYELANIRSVQLFQDFVGRTYDYGHVHLSITSWGMEEDVILTDLKDPRHYKTLFEKYLG